MSSGRRPLPVCIVARGAPIQGNPFRTAQIGSDLMRSYQLARLIRPYLDATVDLSISTFIPGGRLRNFETWIAFRRPAVCILLKNIAYAMTAEQIARLRRRAIAVGVDHIDGDLSQIDLAAFDFHVAASKSGLAALRSALDGTGIPSHLLLHHPDPRLADLDFPPLGEMRAIYLGNPINLHLPAAIVGEVEVFEAVQSYQMEAALPRLPGFNLHYAVRPELVDPRALRAYKPFTKGVTAAACHSNILVNRGVDDAVATLGEDYPYLTTGLGEVEIIGTLDRAHAEFGSPIWAEAADRMAALLAEVSPAALAAQFRGCLAGLD